jgi:hypothetical protein
MIVELNEEEIKAACLDLLLNRKNVSSKNDNIQDVNIIVTKIGDKNIVKATIECDKLEY